MRRIGPAAALASCTIGLCLVAYFAVLPERFGDVRAFYCAGRAVLAHADPYREHPLRDCEHAVIAAGVSPLADDVAVPVPFPGYTLAGLALVALVPFAVAAPLWLAASAAAVVAATVRLARVLHVRGAAIATVIAFPTVVAAIAYGQLTPFVLFAIATAADAAARGRPRRAAFAALGTMLEPHVGIAIVLALAAGERRARVTLAVGMLALCAVSMLVLGVDRNVEYVRSVLAAHAQANVMDRFQYSAAHFLVLAGMSASRACAIGNGWFVVVAAVGVGVAARLRARLGAAGLVLVPPVFEVFGGVHVHVTQIDLAIPGLILLAQSTTRARAALSVLVFFAAIPWIAVANFPMLVPAAAVAGLAFAIALDAPALAFPLAITASTFAIGVWLSFLAASGTIPVPFIAHPPGNPLAETSWSMLMRARSAHAPLGVFTVAKLPTLAALAASIVCFVRAAVRAQPDLGGASVSPVRKVRGIFADT